MSTLVVSSTRFEIAASLKREVGESGEAGSIAWIRERNAPQIVNIEGPLSFTLRSSKKSHVWRSGLYLTWLILVTAAPGRSRRLSRLWMGCSQGVSTSGSGVAVAVADEIRWGRSWFAGEGCPVSPCPDDPDT